MGNVILGLLMLSPMTLYALNKQFEGGISLFYAASLGSIRAAVLRLHERELVDVTESVESGRSKKTYAITDAGRAEFTRWMVDPVSGSDVEKIALAKLYLLGLIPAEQRGTVLSGIVNRVRADRASLEQLGAHLDAVDVPAEYADVFRYQRLTLEYGLQAHRNGERFFEEIRAEMG